LKIAIPCVERPPIVTVGPETDTAFREVRGTVIEITEGSINTLDSDNELEISESVKRLIAETDTQLPSTTGPFTEEEPSIMNEPSPERFDPILTELQTDNPDPTIEFPATEHASTAALPIALIDPPIFTADP